MYRIVYLSQASASLGQSDLDEILRVARANNQRRNLTGLLLHVGDTFFQVLEGPRQEVEAVFDRVFHDERHARVRIMQQRDVVERRFRDWSMGFERPFQNGISSSFFSLSKRALEKRIPENAADDLLLLMRGFAETKLT